MSTDKELAVTTFKKLYASGHRDFRGWDFSGAYLKGEVFDGCDLRDANFEIAVLAFASLVGVQMRGANLNNTNLSGAKVLIHDMTIADLREAQGISGHNLNLHQGELEA